MTVFISKCDPRKHDLDRYQKCMMNTGHFQSFLSQGNMDFFCMIILTCFMHDARTSESSSTIIASDYDSSKPNENISLDLSTGTVEEPKFPEVALTQVFDGKDGGEANQADIKVNKFANHEGVLTQNQFNGGVLNLALVHGEAMIIDPKIKIQNESTIDNNKEENTDDKLANQKKILANILKSTVDSSKIAGKSGKVHDFIYRAPFASQPEDHKMLVQHHFFDGRQGLVMQNQYNGDYSTLSGPGLTPHFLTGVQRNDLFQHRKLDAKQIVQSAMEKYQNLVDHALKDHSGDRKGDALLPQSSSLDLAKILGEVKNMRINPKNVRIHDYSVTNGEKMLFDESRLPMVGTSIKPSTPIASNSIPNPIILTFPGVREAPITSNSQTKNNNFYVADGGQAYQILLDNPTINVNIIAAPGIVPPQPIPENCPACPTVNVTSTENGTTTTAPAATIEHNSTIHSSPVS